MAKSLTIKSIDQRADRTYIRIGKTEIEVPGSKAELKAFVRSRFSEEDLLALALAAWMARDPELNNPNALVGKTITLDLGGRVNYADAILRIA